MLLTLPFVIGDEWRDTVDSWPCPPRRILLTLFVSPSFLLDVITPKPPAGPRFALKEVEVRI